MKLLFELKAGSHAHGSEVSLQQGQRAVGNLQFPLFGTPVFHLRCFLEAFGLADCSARVCFVEFALCGTDNQVLSVIYCTPLPGSALCCPAVLPTAVSRPERRKEGSENCGEEEEQPGHSCRVQSFSFLPALTFHPMGTVLMLTTAKILSIGAWNDHGERRAEDGAG